MDEAHGRAGAGATRSGRHGRRGAVLQFEDLALFGFVAGVEPLLDHWAGRAMADLGFLSSEAPAGAGGPLRGLILLGAALGAVVCLVTRPRGREGKTVAELVGGLEGWARFPLIVWVAAVAAAALEGFGVRTGEGLFFGAVVALGLPLAFYPRLPEIAVPLRRLLMTPIILLGAGLFHGVAAGFLGDGELFAALPARDDPAFGFAVLVLWLLVAGTAAFYVLLVVAPRAVAGAGGGAFWWAARFVLFVAGLGIGARVAP